MQQPSTIKYIKPSKFDTQMFIPIQINENDKQLLKIKNYQGKDYLFLPIKKIKGVQLVTNRIYELEIKTRQWKEFTVITYHLSNTIETLKNSKNDVITKYLKPKRKICLIHKV